MFTPRVQKDRGIPRFMNHPAPANSRYKPTCYEHAANCYTHALLIVPAIVGSALLHRLSDDRWEKITAWMYGVGLCALFIVSTVFHIVSWKKSHLRTMEHCFHMCDRMMIYVFIASSYAPWLNLRELGPLASHMRWFIWLMAAGGTLYVFLYHEKHKIVELFFYLAMGFSPALVVTSMVRNVTTNSANKQNLPFITSLNSSAALSSAEMFILVHYTYKCSWQSNQIQPVIVWIYSSHFSEMLPCFVQSGLHCVDKESLGFLVHLKSILLQTVL
uniref:Monocyte to macrophage differentiation associated n=1 Tax=Zonotrichia albicollis TaxID=44394 RepID=A0A8D2NJ72_ZONAL